jgi:hypothetical protein
MLISMLTGTSTSLGFFQDFIWSSPHDSRLAAASEEFRENAEARTLSC